jgi:hypothetical protein
VALASSATGFAGYSDTRGACALADYCAPSNLFDVKIMRTRFPVLVGTLLALSFEAAPAGAQDVNNDTIAVMKSVGTYLRITYGARLTISSVPICDRPCPDSPLCNRTCPASPARGRERAAVAKSGRFTQTSLSIQLVCSPNQRANECRFANTDGLVNLGGPVINDNHATVAMGIRLNGPDGRPPYHEEGTLALEKRGNHWMVTEWHVHRYID